MTRPAALDHAAPGLTLAYLAAAAVAFVAAAGGVAWLAPALAGHYYHPRVLALAHAIVLGWVTLTIMGASCQLIPQMIQRPLWSSRLARWQLAVMIAGVAGMIAHFFVAGWSGLVWAAALVALGIAAHVVNIGMTLRGVRPWSFAPAMFALALAGVVATAAAGFALALDRIVPVVSLSFYPRLHAHVHLGLLGWIAPMMLGAGAHVYPTFLLAPPPRGWPGSTQVWGLAAGVPLTVAGLALETPAATLAGALGVTVAVAGHLTWIVTAVRNRKIAAIDRGLCFMLTATAFAPVATVIGLGLALDLFRGPRIGLAYAVLVLGWVSLTIAGMMLKIVPFLVWYRVYAPLAGRGPVPALRALTWPRGESLAYGLLTGGITALALAAAVGDAAAIRAAGVVLTAGALAFALAVGVPLSALCRRRARAAANPPLALRSSRNS